MAELRFRGKYDHSIDDKGRLSLPSRFREVLRHYPSEILSAIAWETHLRAYPLTEWGRLEHTLRNGEEGPPEEGERIVRFFQAESSELVLDRQGRILLPPPLRAEAGLKRDIVLIGMIERVEIWDRELWNVEREIGRTAFAAMKQRMNKRGIL